MSRVQVARSALSSTSTYAQARKRERPLVVDIRGLELWEHVGPFITIQKEPFLEK